MNVAGAWAPKARGGAARFGALLVLIMVLLPLSSCFGGRTLQSRAVRITGIDCARSIGGTGALIGGDLVLTSGHVVIGADDLTVHLDTGEQLRGEVLHVDRVLDVAVMRVRGVDLGDVAFGDANTGDVGVVAVLGPGESGAGGLELSMEPYRVERRIRATTDNVGRTETIVRPTLEIVANVERGDSGALLFDRDGLAVGLIWSTSRQQETVGYATRGSELQQVVDAALSEPSGPGSC